MSNEVLGEVRTEKYVYNELMINAINCSMLEPPLTSYNNDMDTCVSKSTALEPTIKYLMKETSLFRREERNFVRRGVNIRA